MKLVADSGQRKVSLLWAFQRWALVLLGFAGMLAWSAPAYAVELTVECSNPKAKLKSINQVLAFLPKQGPNTIHVSGACNENVVIDGFDNLTLTANPGASLNDPTPSTTDDNDVVDIVNSRRVTVEGFTINGGIDGIACFYYSLCFLNNNTVQGASDYAVFVGRASSADLNNDTIKDSFGGLLLNNGATAALFGCAIQGNSDAGASVNNHSLLNLFNIGAGPITVQSNGFDGVFASGNSTIILGFNGAAITGNAGTGVTAEHGSVVRVGGQNQITGNGTAGSGAGVGVGESSFAFVAGSADLSGNASGPVVCVGTFSNAQGAGANAGLSCHNP